jgi:ribonuclease P protein component
VGNAVVRNRLRRRLRETIRTLPLLEGYDVVITARPEAAKASFHELRQELLLLFRRAKLLDAPASAPVPPSHSSESTSA